MELAGLPPATARLAVELQLADVKAIMHGLGAGDEYTAFEAMRIGFQDILLFLEDRLIAMDILRADHDNRLIYESLVQEERRAEQDHNFACELDGTTPNRTGCSTPTPRESPEDQELWRSNDYQSSYVALASAITGDQNITTLDKAFPTFSTSSHEQFYEIAGDEIANSAESSTRQLSKGKRRREETAHGNDHVTHPFCSACMEQCARFDVLELGCKRQDDATSHAYCRSCLIDLFRTSLTDTTLFPPRCCGKSIPISACLHLCPPELVSQYRDKQIELAMPNPVYCSNRYCAKFIKPESVTADVALCPSCGEETCTVCKNPRHKGLCPEDPTVQMLMDVAGEKRGNDALDVGPWSNYSWAVTTCGELCQASR